jgi:hypothetical protein
MMCIGSNLKPLSLTDEARAKIAEMVRMQPHEAEWCFSNRMKSSFLDYDETGGEWSTDEESTEESMEESTEESTEESADEPLTDYEEDLANMTSAVCMEECVDQASDVLK